MFDAVGPDRSLELIVSTVGPIDTAEPFMPGPVAAGWPPPLAAHARRDFMVIPLPHENSAATTNSFSRTW